MRAVFYNAETGAFTNAIELPNNWIVDADGLAARGPATYMSNGEPVEYEGRYSAPDGSRIVFHAEAADGWVLTDGEWVAPEPEPEPEPELEQVTRVSTMQAKLALKYFGLFEQIETFMLSLPIDADWRIAWFSADRIFRNSSMVTAIGYQFELTDEQMDAMFAYAATLTNV